MSKRHYALLAACLALSSCGPKVGDCLRVHGEPWDKPKMHRVMELGRHSIRTDERLYDNEYRTIFYRHIGFLGSYEIVPCPSVEEADHE